MIKEDNFNIDNLGPQFNYYSEDFGYHGGKLVTNNSKNYNSSNNSNSKSPVYENGLYIFRRDLRLIDNNGLNFLSKHCKNIYTIFIFTPEQVGKSNNYKSNNAIQFMIESLQELASEINRQGGKLYTFYGHNNKVIQDFIKAFNINIVTCALDITPYAHERDEQIAKLCSENDVEFQLIHDYYLNPIGALKTGSGKGYVKFTPYYNNALKHHITKPIKTTKLKLCENSNNLSKMTSLKISLQQAQLKFTKPNPNIMVHGGRSNALALLKHAKKTLKNYEATHNKLDYETSHLSASIKFGCISIREVYYELVGKKSLIRQIYWRDFFANIMWDHPNVLGHALVEKYNKIKWNNNKIWFAKWCAGETGFPIIDAGMRQLNQSGYMHNRARLLVSSFLIKTLLIDWRDGEKYFAQKLTDYDPATNNASWQGQAGIGGDGQPYFRIYNPWRQAELNDPECSYIKTWVPELSELPNKVIFKWYEEWENFKNIGYFKPICIFEEQRKKALAMYRDL